MGYTAYEPLARQYRVPIVVTGFEPLDILQGVYMCLQQLEAGQAEVTNQYTRAVRRHGNQHAQHLIQEVFQIVPRRWRGMGEIPHSGFGLRPAMRHLTPSDGLVWHRLPPRGRLSV
jgi:hydrogenase expression/formation protein HypD